MGNLTVIILALTLAGLCGCTATSRDEPRVEVHVGAAPVAKISDGLFGQFMERATWGEPGPESALVPGTHRLQPQAVELLRGMDLSVVRFPGGTDVDFIDWRDMIDNVPGRTGAGRPVTVGHKGGRLTNNFGLDEFLRLSEELEFTPLLVVKLKTALLKRETLEDVAYQAAALVAYCNAEVDADLPDDLKPWPALRARNGRPKPYGVPLFQIGNETWFTIGELKTDKHGPAMSGDEVTAWYLTCMRSMIQRIREVDRKCELVIDGPTRPSHTTRLAVARDPLVREHVRYLTTHTYAPWNMTTWFQKVIDRARAAGTLPQSFGDRQYWQAWSAMPGEYGEDGACIGLRPRVQFIHDLGFRAVVTEWNWNGWGEQRLEPRPGIDTRLASAVGAAGFLHGLVRDADKIDFACQSMLIGSSWGIAAIRVDPSGESEPYYQPQGLATKLYANHHGTHLLPSRVTGSPTYSIDWLREAPPIAALDALATTDQKRLYLHLINRGYDQPLRVRATFDGLALSGTGKLLRLRGSTADEHTQPGNRASVWLESETLPRRKGRMRELLLPPRTVSIAVLDLE